MPSKPATETQTASPLARTDYRRSDDFRAVYANNSFLEFTAWDLKLIFGQTDSSITPSTVVQHTAITLPWAQVKILAYFMQIHLAAHELDHGRVIIPTGIIPAVTEPDKETAKEWPNSMNLYKIWSKVHADFIAANPEAAPVEKP